jgi:PglZ domain
VSTDVVAPAAVRRKLESWLDEPDSGMVIALRARPTWAGDPTIAVRNITARVVVCPTPMAVRAALHDRRADERMVLLTDLSDVDLGDGLLAHLSRATVRSVNAWDLVREMFGGRDRVTLDPTITHEKFGGGRWVADALTEHAPPDGWPRPPGTIVTRQHVLRSLTGALLSLDGDDLDSAALLQWTTEAPAQLRFQALPEPVIDGVTRFLGEVAGGATIPIMHAVRAGHGIDAIPLGLLMAPLWSTKELSTEAAVARARLEPMFGGARLTHSQAAAFQTAAEGWIDRTFESGRGQEAHRVFARAEHIATEIGALPLLASSDLLPRGFVQRLRTVADSVRLAVPVSGPSDASLVTAAQRAYAAVESHRAADPARLETARMAIRLLRWLGTPEEAAPATLSDALLRQVRADAWVDRARLDIFAGDIDPHVGDAYRRLHQAVDSRRTRHDEQFASLLAANTSANAEPGTMLRVEDVLETVVRPILTHGRRVLLLILDGVSVAAATELGESLTRSGAWMELTRAGQARVGVLAALPTVTEVSRASLLAGRLTTGQQREERAAFAERFPDAVLLHKAALRGGAGAALDSDVVDAVGDAFIPLVAAVINTIDDALDRSDPGTIVWSEDNIIPVRDLLSIAGDRVVVIVSDHGHVVDRGPDGVTRPSPSSENRWRPSAPSAGDGEVAIAGSRVALGGGSVVLPWTEKIRYGPRKAGYHGGASPAEAVIPLIILARDESAVPGWTGAPVASPDWWREAMPDAPVAHPAGTTRKQARQRPQQQSDGLFELPAAAPEPPPVAPGRPLIIDALLGSETYRQRKDARAPLSDERVAALLTILLDNGGRATLETLAARASVPAHRIAGTVAALRKLLQVEGYPVLIVDPDDQTIKLDAVLLAEQFHLDVT